jgi:hypothetical protein
MTEQPRDWEKELANIDRAMAKQGESLPHRPVPTAPPAKRFIALAWFWAVLAILLAVALIVWPYDKSCGIRLIFFLGACLLALLAGVVAGFTSWAHRQGLPLILSLLVILLAAAMAAREVLPRIGYARQSLEWTCPPAPPAPEPAPQPSPQ